jgi:hypothetical protein
MDKKYHGYVLMIVILALLIWSVERIFSPKFRRKILSKVEI